jgi:hypothetical protein
MDKPENTIIRWLGGAIIVFVIHSFLSNYFSDVYIEGKWNVDNYGIRFEPKKFKSYFRMSGDGGNGGSIAITEPAFLADYFDYARDWPKHLAEGCDENKKISMKFYSINYTKTYLNKEPEVFKNKTFTTEHEAYSSSQYPDKDGNLQWLSFYNFSIESTYDSFNSQGGGGRTVYFCNPTKLLKSKILFGLLNYDSLDIRVENASDLVVNGTYRIANYSIDEIKELDLQLIKNMM